MEGQLGCAREKNHTASSTKRNFKGKTSRATKKIPKFHSQNQTDSGKMGEGRSTDKRVGKGLPIVKSKAMTLKKLKQNIT